MDIALQTRQLAITAPIHLVQDAQDIPGILEIWPVFLSPKDKLPTYYAIGVVRLNTMLEKAITRQVSKSNLHIIISDKGATRGSDVFFDSGAKDNTRRSLDDYLVVSEINVANRTWQLMVTPSPAYLAEERQWISWAIGVFGFLFSGLLQVMLLGATGRSVELKNQNEKIRINEQRYIKMFNDCPLPIWLYSQEDNKFLLVNERVAEHYGWTSNEMLLLRHDEVMDHTWPVHTISGVSNADGTVSSLFQCRHKKRDGSTIEVSVNATTANWEGRLAILEVIQDVSAEKKIEEQLFLAGKVFDNCGAGILVTDATCAILAVNPTFCSVTGYSFSECIGKNPRFLNSGINPAGTFEGMWQTLLEQDRWQGELYNKKKNGDIYQALLSIHVVRNVKGGITHFVGAFSDITDFKKAQQQISFMAFHDPLTKLLNRQSAIDDIQGRLLRNKRRIQPFAVMFLDVDKFKFINDAYGHTTGDHLLIEVATRLLSIIRSDDVLFRLSGDEFLVIINNTEDQRLVAGICERIRDVFLEPVRINERVMTISLSIGIAMAPEDGADTEILLRNADTAMYEAKQGGRNTYRFFNQQMNINNQKYMKVSADLRRAITNQEFVLHYQPQYHILTKKIVGLEALIRWQDPYIGMRSPAEFISIAEENGLIVPIGSWVISEACKDAKKWLDSGLDFGRVAVNCSAAQFRLHDIEQDIIFALTHSGLPARYLELELTESILLQKVDDVLGTLIRLKNYGIHLSIDDFGTGYSSLAYLQQFRVDKLKIDQSFIRGITEQLDHLAIVQAIIQLAHGMNLSAIAEGVESEAVLEILKDLGCDEIQGYLFSRPLPAGKVIEFLQRPPVMIY
ncbi:EAL domain-containing protein [Pseudaeromonas sharmana]|uniref:EAL domain-containing protein n=1 Tax=Pseudaeromonas sharmana TaxID=328412 RepID=A0ABV8CPJ4_9GAMM